MSRKQQRTSYNCSPKNVLNFLCRVTRTNDRTPERQKARTTERPNDRKPERQNARTTERPNDRMAERQRQRPSMNSAHYLIKRLPARVVWERDNPAWLHSGTQCHHYHAERQPLVTNFCIFTCIPLLFIITH